MSRRRVALGPFVFAVVLFLLGAVVFLRPFATKDRDVIASTPATPDIFSAPVPLPLEPGDRLCVTQVPLDEETELARFVVYTYHRPQGQPLDIEAKGEGYSFRGRRAGDYGEGPVDVRVTPPRESLVGDFCIRNAGDRRVALQATQVGRKFSRATPYLNEQRLEQDVPLRFLGGRPDSLLGQMGRAIDHAAVFVPLAPWLIWVLLALVLAGIPLAVAWAVAAAATAEPAGVPDPAGSAPPLPLARHAERLRPLGARAVERARAVPVGVWLALVVLGAAGFYWMWGRRTTTFQLDENLYVYLARWVAHSQEAILDFQLFERGIQRLEIWLLAIPLGLMKGADALLVGRALNSLVFASAAVPAYLLVRGLGARAVWALVAAVLVVSGPWVVYATSFLTEPLAYPLAVWVMWAVWRTVVRPSPGTALVALLFIGLAGVARAAFLLLGALLPLSVLLQELRCGDWRRASGARERLTRYARDVWRHRVVVLLMAAGAVALVLAAAGVLPAASRLSGGYGTPFGIHLGTLVDKAGFYASRVVVGTGFVPFAVGLPWIVWQLTRPGDERRHAFALVAALTIVLVLYASQTAGPDERYVMYYGPPLIVAAAVALGRRDMRPEWVAAGGLLAAVLVWRHGWALNLGGYDTFVKPAEVFYTRFLLRLQDVVPSFVSVTSAAFAVLLLLAAAAVYAFTRERRARVTAVAVTAGLVVLQLTQSGYAMKKFGEGPGGRFGAPVTQRDWIDDAIYGRSTATLFVSGQSNSSAFDSIWREVQFWNTSLTSVFAPGRPLIQVPIGDEVHEYSEDEQTGRLTTTDRIPPYAVVTRSFSDRGLAGTVVAQAPYLAADLVRADRPLQLRYHVFGAPADGLVPPGVEVKLRVFSAGLEPATRWCAGVPVFVPVGVDGRKVPITYELAYDRERVRGRIPAEQTGIAQMEVRFGDAPHVDVALRVRGRINLADGRVIAGQLGAPFVVRCKD